MTRPGLVLLALPALALAACNGSRGAAQNADAAPRAEPAALPAASAVPPPAQKPQCAPGNGGITLPRGFCAVVVADSLGAPRHLAVAENGDVYAALTSRRNQPNLPTGVLALRDADGDGRAELRERFGAGAGSGIAISGGWLYFAPNDGVVRWRMPPGRLVPEGGPERVVVDLPTGGHGAKGIALDGRGALFVSIGSLTNSCQTQDRQRGSRGRDPCAELQTRAGVWRFDAERQGQTQAQGERWATGIRNGMALAWNPEAGALFTVSHGRDQLGDWPGFDARYNAENPAEEMFRLDRGTNGGWPYCYATAQGRKVLAPEYGGDGRQVGRCGTAADPVAALPAHWAPNALLFYTGTQFPERYRGGAFIAFHGSWNRAPLPQQGFNVVFVPFRGGAPAGPHEVFADGFAGTEPPDRATARHRPTGLALGPDGSLYVSDDAGGRIWRILWVGGDG